MATYYVDPTRPDDTGAGTSEGAAKKTIRGARLVAVANDTILVKAGYCHDALSGQFFLNSAGHNGMRIAAYGTSSDKPVWDGLTYQNPGSTGWVHVSSGVWKKTFGAWYVRRLFVGSTNNGPLVTDRVVGIPVRRAAPLGSTSSAANPTLESDVLAALSTDRPWFGCGAALSWALYVYTGSASIDPPTFFQGLAFIQADNSAVGAVNPIEVSNMQDFYFKDQVLRAPGGAGIRMVPLNANARDTANFLVENIDVTHVFYSGIRTQRAADVAPTWGIKNGIFRRCTVTYNTNYDELDKSMSEDYMAGLGDGITLNAGTDNVLVDVCSVKDAFHVNYAIGSDVSGTSVANNITIQDSSSTHSPWSTYGRGSASYNGTGHAIRRCTFDGQSVRSQYAGSIVVENNVWKNCIQSTRKPGSSQWCASESYVFDNTSGLGNAVRYQPIGPVDVRILNNTVQGKYFDDHVHLNSYATAAPVLPPAWGSVTIKNNVLLGPSGTVTLRAANGAGNASVISNATVTNNVAFTGSTGDNKVVWKGAGYTLNAGPGCSGNSETDPQLDADYRPKFNSPLLNAGVHVGYTRDLDGKQRPNPPSIGAYDVAQFKKL